MTTKKNINKPLNVAQLIDQLNNLMTTIGSSVFGDEPELLKQFKTECVITPKQFQKYIFNNVLCEHLGCVLNDEKYSVEASESYNTILNSHKLKDELKQELLFGRQPTRRVPTTTNKRDRKASVIKAPITLSPPKNDKEKCTDMINVVYKNIQYNVNEVVDEVQYLVNEYNSQRTAQLKEITLDLWRDDFNLNPKTTYRATALLILLQKRACGSVYRADDNGNYTSKFKKVTSNMRVDISNIRALSKYLNEPVDNIELDIKLKDSVFQYMNRLEEPIIHKPNSKYQGLENNPNKYEYVEFSPPDCDVDLSKIKSFEDYIGRADSSDCTYEETIVNNDKYSRYFENEVFNQNPMNANILEYAVKFAELDVDDINEMNGRWRIQKYWINEVYKKKKMGA